MARLKQLTRQYLAGEIGDREYRSCVVAQLTMISQRDLKYLAVVLDKAEVK